MSKSLIRYAENHTRGGDGKLQLLGWGARRSRTATIMEPPGQVRTLENRREGKDWVFLDWKEPVDGGEAALASRSRFAPRRFPARGLDDRRQTTDD